MAGLEAMLLALPESGWRLAMMSNDPDKALAESQFPLVPGDDIVDAMDMYSAMGRGNREEGFDSAYEYIVNNSYASTWLRPDAALIVVFVSDEEDQSDDYFANVDDFKSWYGSQRGGSAFVASIVNVAAADSVCEHYVNSIDIGDRYMVATNYFSGVHGNYLSPSVERAGMDPLNLPEADKTKMNKNSGGNASSKVWKDIYGSGQGINSIKDSPKVEDLVGKMKAEFQQARSEFSTKSNYY